MPTTANCRWKPCASASPAAASSPATTIRRSTKAPSPCRNTCCRRSASRATIEAMTEKTGGCVMQNVVKVFVGCDPNDCDLEQMMVLDYTLRKHSSLPVEVHWMQLSRDPQSFWYSSPETGEGWRTEAWTTPFSGFRWGIPAFCDYRGKAIYMDTDVMVLCDIAELWNQSFSDGKVVMAKGGEESWRFCVSMWDCERAK